jgi:hypothetical protein
MSASVQHTFEECVCRINAKRFPITPKNVRDKSTFRQVTNSLNFRAESFDSGQTAIQAFMIVCRIENNIVTLRLSQKSCCELELNRVYS